MEQNVFSFLHKHQVEKGSDHTHTSFIKPTGAFYIPVHVQDEFFKVYKRCVRQGESLYVTEKHRDASPILIDLDFRYDKTSLPPERKHSIDDIKIIVQTYIDVLKKYVVISDDLQVFVMEKPGPVVDKVYNKDGIHIVIPDIVTKPPLQYILRKEVLEILPQKLAHLDTKNSWEDVIDEAIIEKNNWMMYGSRKPNGQPYAITHIFDKNLEEVAIDEDDSVYVEVLSIRNKFDITDTTPQFDEALVKYEEEQEKKNKAKLSKMTNSSIFQVNQNIKKNTVTDLDYVKKLVNILDIDRANNYQKWIRLGWCLRNIDYRLLETWIEFSKRSPKFSDGECEKLWNYMKDDGLSIGSLHLWAKEDNPEAYKEIAKNDLSNIVSKSITCTHTDIAKVVHFMYKYDFVCVSISKNYWYEFRNHRWQPCDSGHTLRSKLSDEVCREYYHQAAIWSAKAAAEMDEENRKNLGEKVKRLNEISLKLKTTSFKDNIIKECRELFYIEKFEEKLDSRCHLIGFENGVYDLDSYEFREGRPEDYISFSTGINYTPYKEDEQTKEIHEFLSRIFPKPHMKEYILTLLSSYLNGSIKEQRFILWNRCKRKVDFGRPL